MSELNKRLSHENHIASRVAIGIGVAALFAYEYWCPTGETVTEQTRRWRDTRIGSVVVPFLVRSVAAHLLEEVEPRKDWIHHVAKLKPNGGKPGHDGSDRFDVFETDD